VLRWIDQHPCGVWPNGATKYHGLVLHQPGYMPISVPVLPNSWIRSDYVAGRARLVAAYLKDRVGYDLAAFRGPVFITEMGWQGDTVPNERFTCEQVAAGYSCTRAMYQEISPWTWGFHLWNVGGQGQWADLTGCLATAPPSPRGYWRVAGRPWHWNPGFPDLWLAGVRALWHFWGFLVVIYLAAMSAVDIELYEVARLDGASRFQQFRHVTLPSIRPTLVFTILMIIIWSSPVFDYVYMITGGGPANASEVMATYLYQNAFSRFDAGYAASIGFMMSIWVALAVVGFVLLRRRGWEI